MEFSCNVWEFMKNHVIYGSPVFGLTQITPRNPKTYVFSLAGRIVNQIPDF